MADPRFFNRQGPFTLGQIASICDGTLAEGTNAEALINDVGALAEAEPGSVSFFLNPKKYGEALSATKADAVIVHADHAARVPDGKAVIVADNPHKAYALTAQAFYPRAVSAPGISPHAVIDDSATLGEGLTIAPGSTMRPSMNTDPIITWSAPRAAANWSPLSTPFCWVRTTSEKRPFCTHWTYFSRTQSSKSKMTSLERTPGLT